MSIGSWVMVLDPYNIPDLQDTLFLRQGLDLWIQCVLFTIHRADIAISEERNTDYGEIWHSLR